uniref:Uncharacterized protein n=1 Tax=Physcomitrium patens TaxID=3218 RepID=A9RW90_PHYPA|nr:hypothetical protein PHYPA_014291 [Physcomitrium patens]
MSGLCLGNARGAGVHEVPCCSSPLVAAGELTLSMDESRSPECDFGHLEYPGSLLFQNVQGMNAPEKTKIVRNYLRKHLSTLNTLCFQEHKLRGITLHTLKDTIWPEARFYGQEASVAYSHSRHSGNPWGPGTSVPIIHSKA